LIYLDNASSTKIDEEVLKSMCEFYREHYAIPSSIFSHSEGIFVADNVNEARENIAKHLRANPDEIIFTSSGTESNNLAIKGFAYGNKEKGRHLITSKIEHISVLESFKRLEKEGFEVTYLPVDSSGFVDIDELKRSIRDDTILVSVQLANQEVGTVQDIDAISRIVKEKGIAFHVDGAIAVPYVDVDLSFMPIDLLTISPHKFYGQKELEFCM